MRVLLVTVLVVIAVVATGIGVLAISPAPDRTSDSMTLVIETGSIGKSPSDKSPSELTSHKDGESTTAASDRTQTADRDRAKSSDDQSLEEVIAQRLREADAQSETPSDRTSKRVGKTANTTVSAADRDNKNLTAKSTERLSSPDTASQAREATETDFASVAENDPAPGTVSITEMLASELEEDDDSASKPDDESPREPVTQPALMASDPTTTGALPATDKQKSTQEATSPDSGAEEKKQQAQVETQTAALDPQVRADEPLAETPEAEPATRDPAESEAREDQSPSDRQPDQTRRAIAAKDAPALPQKRGAFRVKGKIALIIRGLGVDPNLTGQAIDNLPHPVAMAFVPYGNDLKKWTKKARQQRHDILLQIPLEPNNYPDENPGPHTLLSSLSIDENLKRLDWLIDRFSAISGVTNYRGGKFGKAPGAMAPVLMELKARNLLYIDDGTAANTTARQLARQISLAYSVADIVIDNDRASASIEKALSKLEAQATSDGAAIAIGHAHKSTMRALEKWIETLTDKGLVLVPISELAAPPPARRVSQSTDG